LNDKPEISQLFIFIKEVGSYNFIPYFRAYTKSFSGILVMVPHMMVFNSQPEFIMHIKMMDCVMGHIVKEITCKKPCHKGGDINISHNRFEQKEEKKGQRNAYRGGHNESFGITGIVVMHAMENKMYPLTEFRIGHIMENESMQQIFGKGPY
jgi:hypothetical protein